MSYGFHAWDSLEHRTWFMGFDWLTVYSAITYLIVRTLQIGSYSGLDSGSSWYGIPSGKQIENRLVYLVYNC